MAQLGADGRCLMRALQEELDDPAPEDCGRCSVCAGPRYDGPLDPALVREASLHLRSRPLVLEVKKMAPDAEGAMRKIPEAVRAEEGRALARLGDGGWDPLVQAGRSAGRFDDELVGGGRRGGAGLGRAGRVGRRDPVAAQRRARARLRARAGRAARDRRSPTCSRAWPTARRSARWPTPTSRSPTCAARFAVTAAPPRGRRAARRRHPLQRLDAGDGGRPAAGQGRRGGLPAGAEHRLLSGTRRSRLRQAAPGSSTARLTPARGDGPVAPCRGDASHGSRRDDSAGQRQED